MEEVQLLDMHYLQRYKVFISEATDYSAEERGDGASLKLLQGVCNDPVVTFDDNASTWSLTLNVLCYGTTRVERWTFTGTLDKFSIEGWNRQVLIEGGKIHPLILTF